MFRFNDLFIARLQMKNEQNHTINGQTERNSLFPRFTGLLTFGQVFTIFGSIAADRPLGRGMTAAHH